MAEIENVIIGLRLKDSYSARPPVSVALILCAFHGAKEVIFRVLQSDPFLLAGTYGMHISAIRIYVFLQMVLYVFLFWLALGQDGPQRGLEDF